MNTCFQRLPQIPPWQLLFSKTGTRSPQTRDVVKMAYQVKSFKDMKMTIQIGHLPLEGSDQECGQRKRRRTDSGTRSGSGTPPPTQELNTLTAATSCTSQTGSAGERRGAQPVAIKEEPVWDDSLLSSTGFSFCQFSTDRLLTEAEVTRTDADAFRDLNASSVRVKTEPYVSTSEFHTTEHAMMPPQTKEQTLTTFEQCGPVIQKEPDDSGLGLKIVSVSSGIDLARTHFQSESAMTSDSTDSKSAESSSIPSRDTFLHSRPTSAPLDANRTDRRTENDARPRANSVTNSCHVRPPLLPNKTSSSALQVPARPVVVKQEVEEKQNTATHGFNAENPFAGHPRQDQFYRAQQARQPQVILPAKEVSPLNAATGKAGKAGNCITTMDVDGDSNLSASGSNPRRKEEEKSRPACGRGLDRTGRLREEQMEGARDVHKDQPTQTDLLIRQPVPIPVLHAYPAVHREMPSFRNLQKPSLSTRPPVSFQAWVPPATGTGAESLHNPLRKPSTEHVACCSNTSANPNHAFYNPQDVSTQGVTMVNYYPSSSVTAKAAGSGDHHHLHPSFLHGQPDVRQVSARVHVDNPQGSCSRPVVNLPNTLPKDSNAVMNFEKSAFGSSRLSTCTPDALSHSAPAPNPSSQCVPTTRVHHQNHSIPVTIVTNTPASILGSPELRGGKHHHRDCVQNPVSTICKKPQHVCGVCRKLFSDRMQCIMHVKHAHIQVPGLNQPPLKETIPVKVVVQPQQRLAPVHPVAVGHCDRSQGNLSNTQTARTQNRTQTNLTRPGTLNRAATHRQKESTVQGETHPRRISQANSQTISSIRTTEKRPRAGSSSFSQVQTAASAQRNTTTVVCSLCSRQCSDDLKYSAHLQATLQRTGWYYCLSCKTFITDVEDHLTQDDLPHQVQKIKHLCAGCGQSFTCILTQRGYASSHLEDIKGMYASSHLEDVKGMCASSHLEDIKGMYASSHLEDIKGMYASSHLEDIKGMYASSHLEDIKGNDCGKGIPPSHRSAVPQKNFPKDHRCLVCGDSFSQLEYLKFHMRKHSGDCIS